MLYFDHAATTVLDPRVCGAMLEVWDAPLNPSSIHAAGQCARRLLEDARGRILEALNAPAGSELIFTSGATEAANLVIRGLEARQASPMQVVSSALEHSCVRDTLDRLAGSARLACDWLAVSPNGRARLDMLPERADLLCLMHANNETGVIQDTASARAARERLGAMWLCDASQSPGKTRLDLGELGADFVILSAHKIHGPAGIGCLIASKPGAFVPQITGGPQEDEMRAGTQAVALAAGFARAMELAFGEATERQAHLRALEKELLAFLREKRVGFLLNGEADRLPGFVNLGLAGFEAADLAIALDQAGYCVSPGSACSTGAVGVSPVLEAMFPDDPARAGGGIRITFGKENTLEEARRLAGALARLSPPAGG